MLPVNRNKPTILVVDDEQTTRRLTRQIFELCGYEVLEASDGAEAEAVINDEGTSIDSILFDVNMPYQEVPEECAKKYEKDLPPDANPKLEYWCLHLRYLRDAAAAKNKEVRCYLYSAEGIPVLEKLQKYINAQGYIPKPSSVDDMINIVGKDLGDKFTGRRQYKQVLGSN